MLAKLNGFVDIFLCDNIRAQLNLIVSRRIYTLYSVAYYTVSHIPTEFNSRRVTLCRNVRLEARYLNASLNCNIYTVEYGVAA